MPSTISAGTTAGTAIAVAGDTTGNLAFQTNGTTTAMTIDTSQNVAVGTTNTGLGKLTAQGTITAKASADESILSISHNGSEAVISASYGSTGSYDPMIFKTSDVERGRFDTSGNFQFNSGYGSSAVAYGCRAWVCFNGTGTPSVRASGNISSITDNGTGDYTANFTNAMPDINYSVGGNSAGTPNSDGCSITGLGGSTNYRSTSSVRFLFFYNPGNTTTDRDYINLQIFR